MALEVLQFVVPGPPKAKGRPRFTSTGHAYTDAKTRAAETSVLAAWLAAFGNRPPTTLPVAVTVQAVFSTPRSWPKWRRDSAYWVTARPDLDNLVKILDGLNGVAWVDDAQVVHLVASKIYGGDTRPHTRIQLEILYPADNTPPSRITRTKETTA